MSESDNRLPDHPGDAKPKAVETLEEFARRVNEAVAVGITSHDAYNAGYDCGRDGPNISNCALAYFATRERTAEWERGKTDGERAKAADLEGTPK